MNLTTIIETIWATQKDTHLEKLGMQSIQPLNAHQNITGKPVIAVDIIGFPG